MDVTKVLEAFDEWSRAKSALRACYVANSEYSPDYACYHAAQAEETARIKAGEVLQAFVDSRIADLTGAA